MTRLSPSQPPLWKSFVLAFAAVALSAGGLGALWLSSGGSASDLAQILVSSSGEVSLGLPL